MSPEPASHDPEESVDGSQSWPRLLAFKDGELLAKGEVFEHQTAARPKPTKHGSEPEPKQVRHGNKLIADPPAGCPAKLLISRPDRIVTRDNIKKSRYTLGDEVALLPCSATSDSLAFVHGEGSVLTGGKKAFGALIGGQSSSSGTLRITFVDAKSGDVLAYALFSNNGKFEHDPQSAYGKKLGKELKKIGIGPHEMKKK